MEYPRMVRRPNKPPEAWGTLERANAIEKWGRMREKTVEHFKFTPRTTTYCVIWAFLVPLGLMHLIKWERRQKSIAKGKTPPPML